MKFSFNPYPATFRALGFSDNTVEIGYCRARSIFQKISLKIAKKLTLIESGKSDCDTGLRLFRKDETVDSAPVTSEVLPAHVLV